MHIIYENILFLYQAIQKGNIEGARIHGENAIRQKNQVRRCQWKLDSSVRNVINDCNLNISFIFIISYSLNDFQRKV